MTERLIVKNFVGIKDLEIEVKKINILIGPQASGKSICAKLLFYFKNFPWDILVAVENEETKRAFDSNCSKRFIEYFPLDSWGNDDFSIEYKMYNIFIKIVRTSNSKSRILITYADFYKQELLQLRKVFKEIRENKVSKDIKYERLSIYAATHYLQKYLSSSICKEASFNQLFIPAGRSFFANLQTSIFSFLYNNNALDPFLKAFGSIYENSKRFNLETIPSKVKEKHSDKKHLQDEINKLVEKSLCGKYIRYKGRDYIETVDHRRISLAKRMSEKYGVKLNAEAKVE
jgi:hypothetical protein